MLPIAPEGYPYILLPALAGMLVWAFGYQTAALALWAVALLCVSFFRDPARLSAAESDAILSPADGKVIAVGDAPEPIAAAGLPVCVSIFMSPANVHVNRAPITGTATEVRYSPGRKFPAFREKASELNEHSFVRLEGASGAVAYKQIAGSIARRVVCDLKRGDAVDRGQRVGIIKFSSRVDLFLPADATVAVRDGERTRAGVTVIASFAVADGR
jgi:phosphatidylserine decarboxylase